MLGVVKLYIIVWTDPVVVVLGLIWHYLLHDIKRQLIPKRNNISLKWWFNLWESLWTNWCYSYKLLMLMKLRPAVFIYFFKYKLQLGIFKLLNVLIRTINFYILTCRNIPNKWWFNLWESLWTKWCYSYKLLMWRK